MRNVFSILKEKRKTTGLTELGRGVGASTGGIILENLATTRVRNDTVIGDAVKVA